MQKHLFFLYAGFAGLCAGIMSSTTLMSISTVLLMVGGIIRIRESVPACGVKGILKAIVCELRGFAGYLPFSLLIFLGVYLVWSLAYSESIFYGMKDLRIKVSVWLLPFSLWLLMRDFRDRFFSLVDTALMLCAFVVLFYIFFKKEATPYISHIRVTLICFLLACCGFFMEKNAGWMSYSWRILFSLILFFYIFSLGAGTLLLTFFLTMVFYLILMPSVTIHSRVKLLVLVFLLVISLSGVLFYYYFHHRSRGVNRALLRNIPYENYGGCFKENGYVVWDYINWHEVSHHWYMRSKKKFEEVREYLFRYLASKGLPKDSLGIWSLSDEEVRDIENGATNYLLYRKPLIFTRIYEMMRGLYLFFCGDHTQLNSTLQRLIHLSVSLEILREVPLIGYGIGSINNVFERKYFQKGIPLHSEFSHRAHNQFVTFIISSGIAGVVFVIIALLPLCYCRWDLCGVVAYSCFIAGCLTDDITETHAGSALTGLLLSIIFMVMAKSDKLPSPNKTAYHDSNGY